MPIISGRQAAFVTLVIIYIIASWQTEAGSPYVIDRELSYYEKVLMFSEKIESDPRLKAEWQANLRNSLDPIPITPANFTCNVTGFRSAERPTSVHMLRPGDIDVVAAFGDSISAGNGLGAETYVQVAIEHRGEVFSIGGDKSLEDNVITLPNILRKFNPNLKGFSVCAATEGSADRSWFNVAKPGGTCDDMLTEAEWLVDRMKNDHRVDFENDWKMLTMFVGGNDLCASCRKNYSAEAYYAHFENALTYLSENLNRTIINLVSMFDVTPLQNFSTGFVCDMLQWGFCDCARNFSTIPTMRPLQLAYHDQYVKLSNDPRFKRDDFTVVLQPHLRDMVPPRNPETGEFYQGFLSPDCFHPQRVAHQAFAVYLWNTLLVPVGQKPTSYDSQDFDVPINCPTEQQPYIFTDQNSGLPSV